MKYGLIGLMALFLVGCQDAPETGTGAGIAENITITDNTVGGDFPICIIVVEGNSMQVPVSTLEACTQELGGIPLDNGQLSPVALGEGQRFLTPAEECRAVGGDPITENGVYVRCSDGVGGSISLSGQIVAGG